MAPNSISDAGGASSSSTCNTVTKTKTGEFSLKWVNLENLKEQRWNFFNAHKMLTQ